MDITFMDKIIQTDAVFSSFVKHRQKCEMVPTDNNAVVGQLYTSRQTE